MTRRSSQTIVEFALVIPLLALMLFAIIQYGFLFAAQITVRNASAVGARRAVLSGGSAADAQAIAQQAVAPLLNPHLVTATLQATNIAGATAQSMTVSYPYPLIIPFVIPGGGKTRTLTSTTIMQ